MDEGVIVVAGVYLAKYFVGGSGCAVAESQRFKVGERDAMRNIQIREGSGCGGEGEESRPLKPF